MTALISSISLCAQVQSAPKSGYGSTIPASANMRAALHNVVNHIKKVLNKKEITILDSSCGDLTWMPLFLKSHQDVRYTGYDLIPDNIDNANKRFAHESWKFEQKDIVETPITERFDLVINRHTAIHLGLRDGVKMFRNIVNSNSSFLITTTFPDVTVDCSRYIKV